MLSLVPAVAALVWFDPSLTITRQTTVFDRPAEMGPPSQGKIQRPVVSGVEESLRGKVQRAISFEEVFAPGVPLAESGAVGYDFEDDYFVGSGVLSITLKLELMGAYPTTDYAYVNVDLNTGKTIVPSTAFTRTAGLVAMAEKARKASVVKALAAASADERETISRQLHGKFTAKNLKDFRVDAKGVTFVYDYDFIHAVKALEPEGRFRFSWSQMKPFVRRSGPLARFL